MSAETFTKTEEIQRLGASGLLVVRLTDYCIKKEQAGYARGFFDGVSSNEQTLTGHAQISKWLGCSRRKSQQIVADLKKRGLLKTKRGRPVRVSKELLKDCEN